MGHENENKTFSLLYSIFFFSLSSFSSPTNISACFYIFLVYIDIRKPPFFLLFPKFLFYFPLCYGNDDDILVGIARAKKKRMVSIFNESDQGTFCVNCMKCYFPPQKKKRFSSKKRREKNLQIILPRCCKKFIFNSEKTKSAIT